MSNPKISVVIPTYNRADSILKTIDSVLVQTFHDFEILIIDDGSEDNTKEIIENLNSPKIKYIYQENAGASSARNTGIKNSEGEFIAFLDSDDTWFPEKLEKQLNVFEHNKNIDIVYSAFEWIQVRIDKKEINRYKNYEKKEDFVKFLLCEMLPICPISMMKKTVFDKVGVFDENLVVSEDWDLCLRFVSEFNFYYLDEVLTSFYRHNKSLSATADFEKVKKTHLIVLERFFNNTENIRKYGKFKALAFSHQYFVFALSSFYRARENETKPPLAETLKYLIKGFCYSPHYYFSKRQNLRFLARFLVYLLCRK